MRSTRSTRASRSTFRARRTRRSPDDHAVATINDDDELSGPLTLSVSDTSVIEELNAQASFTVSLSEPTSATVSVDYATADGSAIQPGDYTQSSGTLIFTPGQTTKTVIVPISEDALDEIAETFSLVLSSPTGATIADGSGTGTISDDDLPPGVSVGDATVTEGNAGSVTAQFTISLTGPSAKTASVDWSTADVSATQPGDYAPAGGTVSFSPGQTSKKVSVPSTATRSTSTMRRSRSIYRPDQRNADRRRGTGTITDDDQPVSASIGDISLSEGTGGTTAATFPVTLSAVSGRAITIAYATADGSARQPSDYTSTTGTLVIPAGAAERDDHRAGRRRQRR